MRMRKLGHGQSVVFCAPPEVDRRIREGESIDSVKVIDVLSWVMSNTCIDIEHHIPHWVQRVIYPPLESILMDIGVQQQILSDISGYW